MPAASGDDDIPEHLVGKVTKEDQEFARRLISDAEVERLKNTFQECVVGRETGDVRNNFAHSMLKAARCNTKLVERDTDYKSLIEKLLGQANVVVDRGDVKVKKEPTDDEDSGTGGGTGVVDLDSDDEGME